MRKGRSRPRLDDARRARRPGGARPGRGEGSIGLVCRCHAGSLPPAQPPLAYARLPNQSSGNGFFRVYERVGAGRGEFLSELRPACHVRPLRGIDYDNDDEAHLLLDHFIRRAQRVIDGTAATFSSSRSATRRLHPRRLRCAAGSRGRRRPGLCGRARCPDLETGTAVTACRWRGQGRLRSGPTATVTAAPSPVSATLSTWPPG